MDLHPPYMPGPRMGSHATRELRLAGEQLESVKRELAIKAKTAHRYYEQWKKTKNPELERTWKTESMLYNRLVQQIGPPAAARYLHALRLVIAEGGRPIFELVADLLRFTREVQLLGMESHVHTEGDLRHLAGRICMFASRAYRDAATEQNLEKLVSAIIMAQALGATSAAQAAEEELQEVLGEGSPRLRRENVKKSVGRHR